MPAGQPMMDTVKHRPGFGLVSMGARILGRLLSQEEQKEVEAAIERRDMQGMLGSLLDPIQTPSGLVVPAGTPVGITAAPNRNGDVFTNEAVAGGITRESIAEARRAIRTHDLAENAGLGGSWTNMSNDGIVTSARAAEQIMGAVRHDRNTLAAGIRSVMETMDQFRRDWVQRRAYEIWVAHGRSEGTADEDWAAAERDYEFWANPGRTISIDHASGRDRGAITVVSTPRVEPLPLTYQPLDISWDRGQSDPLASFRSYYDYSMSSMSSMFNPRVLMNDPSPSHSGHTGPQGPRGPAHTPKPADAQPNTDHVLEQVRGLDL